MAKQFASQDSGGLAIEADLPYGSRSLGRDGDDTTKMDISFTSGGGGFSAGSRYNNFDNGPLSSIWDIDTARLVIDHEYVDGGSNPTWNTHIDIRSTTASTHPSVFSDRVLELAGQSGPRARVIEVFNFTISLATPSSISIFFFFKPDSGTINTLIGHFVYDAWIEPSHSPGAINII